MPRILYINRAGAAGERLLEALAGSDFQIEALRGLFVAGDALRSAHADIVLLACERPDGTIRGFCSAIRELSTVPIVVCSASSRESDIVGVFEAGADDCLSTPLRPVELTARLRAVLRRTSELPRLQPAADTLVAGDVEVRVKEHRAYRRGVAVDLSPMEFRLLSVLVHEVGRAVSHSRLIASVWGPEYVDCRHYLRLYIKYLRAKIEDDPRDPKLIVSEWGVGYRFEPASLASVRGVTTDRVPDFPRF